MDHPVSAADVFVLEGFRFDRRGGGLFRLDSGDHVVVGSRALDVLGVLIGRAGDLVTKDEIMAAAWPDTVVEDGNLTVQISTLRRILDQARAEGSAIQTVPGRGYRFVGKVAPCKARADLFAPPSPGVSGEPGVTDQPQSAAPLRGVAFNPSPSRGGSAGLRRGIVATVAALCLLGSAWYSISEYRWAGSAAAALPPRMSIAVLPFSSFGGDREQQSFAAAVTEDLTTDLSRLDTVLVSRNLAFAYPDTPVDAKQIGRELFVRYVLEGSVERSNDRVRINVQLIDAATAALRWAERFDSDVGDVLALQNDITARIASTLSVQLVGAEVARRTAAPDALDYSLRGRAALNKGPSRANYTEAIRLFDHALALDPQSPAMQGMLANTLMSCVLEQMTDTHAADVARAEGLIDQVLTKNPRSSRAHFAMGQALRAKGRCEEAVLEYETSIALNRNWKPNAFVWIGGCLLHKGQFDAAIPLMEQAVQLSPDHPFISSWYAAIGDAHLLQLRTDAAISWLEKSRSANPGRPATHALLAAAFGLKGETERAAAELAAARRLSGDGSYASIAALQNTNYSRSPKGRALYEATYVAGLRKAGMPEK